MSAIETAVSPAALESEVYGDDEPDHLASWGEIRAARRENRAIVADCGVVLPFRVVQPDGHPLCVRCAEIATAAGAEWPS